MEQTSSKTRTSEVSKKELVKSVHKAKLDMNVLPTTRDNYKERTR